MAQVRRESATGGADRADPAERPNRTDPAKGPNRADEPNPAERAHVTGGYRLAHRIRLGVAASWASAWFLASLFSVYLVWYELGEGFDSKLQEAAQMLLSIAARAPDTLREGERGDRRALTGLLEHEEYIVYQVRDAAGRILIRSHDAPAPALAPLEAGFSDQGEWRVYTEPDAAGTMWLHVADARSHRREGIWHAIEILSVPFILVLPLTAWLLGRWITRALRPLELVAAELERRGSDDLSPLSVSGDAIELRRLTEGTNQLMARLERALAQERDFAARAAHELRTPLAAALGQVQLLAAQGDAEARQRALRIEARLQQLVRTVELLLQWTRAEAGAAFAVTPVDLHRVVDVVLAECDPEGRVDLVVRGFEKAPRVLAHVDSLGIVLSNLLTNARRHGGAQARIGLLIAPVAQGVRVTVRDDGPGVEAETLARLGHRIDRKDRQPGGLGLGLGLALSSTLAVQMGATLGFESPLDGTGRGFAAHLTMRAAHP